MQPSSKHLRPNAHVTQRISKLMQTSTDTPHREFRRLLCRAQLLWNSIRHYENRIKKENPVPAYKMYNTVITQYALQMKTEPYGKDAATQGKLLSS
mmetsp:Transcript_1683/g.3054  ORF Transcript_1683/g.3054 Transcript_1683/m.3054 type:complete len:96 (+) Transcript_1683:155-442(+)